MDDMRFIDLQTHTAHQNMAIDESIMLALERGSVPPTLRLYRWKPSAVSIGTFQGMRQEVDVDFCRSKKIDVVRRITGGGAVYHDYEGDITYSIILPKGHPLALDDIPSSYERLCQGLVMGFQELGIESQFVPINDILAGGKKLSGNAQTRRHECLLQHGTVLVDLDVQMMFSILKVHPEKISDKLVTDVKQRVTSVRDLLGTRVPMEQVRDALKSGFTKALGVNLVPGKLTARERLTAVRLVRQKYSTDAWNFLR